MPPAMKALRVRISRLVRLHQLGDDDAKNIPNSGRHGAAPVSLVAHQLPMTDRLPVTEAHKERRSKTNKLSRLLERPEAVRIGGAPRGRDVALGTDHHMRPRPIDSSETVSQRPNEAIWERAGLHRYEGEQKSGLGGSLVTRDLTALRVCLMSS